MFVSDFLSRFSSDNKEDEPMPYLTNTLLLNITSNMSVRRYFKFNYNTGQGYLNLTRFLLQDLKPNFRRLQLLVVLHQAQTGQDLL